MLYFENLKKIFSIKNVFLSKKSNGYKKKFLKFSENPENVNLQEIWKVLKSLGPRFKNTNPIAKETIKEKLYLVLIKLRFW